MDDGAELHLVLQLRDDLARSRMREAFWISVVVHLVLIIALALSPKYIKFTPVLVATPHDLIANDKELTYVDLAHDNQQVKQRPDTNVVSDKDRIAMSKHPTIDREALRHLTDSHPAPPGPPGPRAPQIGQAQPPMPQGGPHPSQGQGQQSGGPQQAQPSQTARLEGFPQRGQPQVPPGAFQQKMSAGSAIQQATRAAASRPGFGGGGGDYGSGFSGARNQVMGNAEILSDTMGVDFGPYLQRVLHTVRENWYVLIPIEARAPLLKQGLVRIEFAIMKDGSVPGLSVVGKSGDAALDRAAFGSITASRPFQPLPNEFQGPFLALRFHFYYNPDKSMLQ